MEIIQEYDLQIRKRSTWLMIFLSIITNGYYMYVWLWKTINDMNKLEISKKTNFWAWAIPLFIIDVIDLYYTIVTWNSDTIFTSADKAISKIYGLYFLIFAYNFLPKIEEYAKNRWGTVIKYNRVLAFFFNILYCNFALNDFSKRIKKAKFGSGAN